MYMLSPSGYSYFFCLCSMAIFLTAASFLVKSDKQENIGFNFLFSFTFFCVNFIYPIFIYPIFPTFSLFGVGTDYNVISKSTALATLAYTTYALGYFISLIECPIVEPIKQKCIIIEEKRTITVSFVNLIVLVSIIGIGGLGALASDYSSDGGGAGPIFSFLYSFFISFAVFSCVANRYIDNILLYFVILLILLSFLFTGSRTLIIMMGSVLFCYFCEKFKISKLKILLLILAGFILMSIIGKLRLGIAVDSGTADVGVWSMAEDFIVVSRSLYDIYGYVQENSITYGLSVSSYLLSVFPFFQGIFVRAFGVEPYEMRSDTLATYWALGKDSALGLGSNIVGDIYLAFGFLGVVLLFFYLGFMVVKVRYYSLQGYWVAIIVYQVLISGAIFMCRSSYFFSLKNIVWALAFCYLLRNVKFSNSSNV